MQTETLFPENDEVLGALALGSGKQGSFIQIMRIGNKKDVSMPAHCLRVQSSFLLPDRHLAICTKEVLFTGVVKRDAT